MRFFFACSVLALGLSAVGCAPATHRLVLLPAPAATDAPSLAAPVHPLAPEPPERFLWNVPDSEQRFHWKTPDSAGTRQPEPAPFADRETVRYAEFIDALRGVAKDLEANPNVQEAYRALLSEFALDESELSLESFSRVRLVFEAARDGGLWDVRWAITDQLPRSDRIWTQWQSSASDLEQSAQQIAGEHGPSAIAECDELSALFAFLARDLGVSGVVALHWPMWNHTVAVWEVSRHDGRAARIVVPTSQVFLTPGATLGTRELPTRRVVFGYRRQDVKPDSELSGHLVRFLLLRARTLGASSTSELTARRNRLGGS